MQADLEVIEVSAEEALAEARAHIRKERKRSKAAEAERSELEQAQAHLQAELEKERTRNDSESKVAQEELKVLAAKNAELRTDHDKVKQEVDAQRKRAEELESKVQSREANLATLKEELHRAQQEKSEQQERADQLATKNKALTNEYNSMKRHAEEKQTRESANNLAKDTQIQGLLTAREELETRLKATMTETSETKKGLEVEKAKRTEGEERLESYKAKYERIKKEKETCRQLLSIAEKDKKMAEEKFEKEEKKRECIAAKLHKWKQEQSRAQEEQERMKTELEKLKAEKHRAVKELETLKREKERTSQQQACKGTTYPLQSPKPARPSSEGEKYYSPERTVPVTVRRISPPGARNFLSSAVSPSSNSHTIVQQVQSGCVEQEKCVGDTDMSRPLLEMLTPPHDGEDEDAGGNEVGRGVISQEATTMRQQVRFGDTYMFQIGKRDKAKEVGRNGAYPCDDAMSADCRNVVICDGVSAGGAASGELARNIVLSVMKRAAAPDDGELESARGVFSSCSRSPVTRGDVSCPISSSTCIRSSAHVPVSRSHRLLRDASMDKDVQRIFDRDKDIRGHGQGGPSTTATVVSLSACLHDGSTGICVDATEVGDSRWALLQQGPDGVWVCAYLSKAHMYKDQPTCPLQLDARHAAEFFLDPRNVGSKLEKTPVHRRILPNGHEHMIVAGSDGLWDNFHEGAGKLKHKDLKEKLATFCNRSWAEWSAKLGASYGKDPASLTVPFVRFLGSRLRSTLMKTLEGPQWSTLSNTRVSTPDDVSIFIGSIDASPFEPHLAQQNTQLPSTTAGGATPEAIQHGVELENGKLNSETRLPAGGCTTITQRFPGYKTRKCRAFDRADGCRYGDLCWFAHKENEIRCHFWAEHKVCPSTERGSVCRFRHDNGTMDLVAAANAWQGGRGQPDARVGRDDDRRGELPIRRTRKDACGEGGSDRAYKRFRVD